MTSLTSPLIHMWSLALEEQFYLVWPLVVLGALKVFRSLWALLAVSIVGALASALEMALLYKPGNTTRLYFGTDTHAQSVLVGATLAVALAMWSERRGNRDWAARTRAGRWALTVIGAVGVAVSAVLYTSVKSTDSIAYRGGFLLAAVAASAVLLSVSCAQDSPVAKLFSFPPFTFIGRISYGMYLWHFPLFTYINHARTGLSGWALFGVRFVPTLLIATASFYLVERPIRTGKLFTAWRSWTFTPLALVAVVIAVLLATEAPAVSATERGSASGALPATPIRSVVPAAYLDAPVRVLLVGDSEALTLGFGLSAATQASPEALPHDAGGPRHRGLRGGRRLDLHQSGSGRPVGGLAVLARPCPGELPAGRCLRSQSTRALPGLDIGVGGVGEAVGSQRGRPAGRGAEVLDRVFDGATTNILNPVFAGYVKSQLEKAVRIATAGGALMVFMTKPCQSTGEQPDGSPWPEDSPARQAVYNSLLRQVAANNVGKVYLQDLNSYVCPGGTYSATLHGVPVRSPDGVHFVYGQKGTGGDYLAPAILPYWERAWSSPGGGDPRVEHRPQPFAQVLRSVVAGAGSSGGCPSLGWGQWSSVDSEICS